VGTLTVGRVKLPAAIRQRFEVDRFCNLGAPAQKSDEPIDAETA
jgi:hypothetical protein